MPYNFFKPIPGRFGIAPVLLTSGRLNTGTLAAGTQTHTIGSYPNRQGYISAISVSAETWPTAATSCDVVVKKYDASASSEVTITSSLDINDSTDKVALLATILSTLTDAERTLDIGDTLTVEIVTVGAVSVQPDDVVVCVELLLQS